MPGCCAAIAALSISGFDAREFSFYGFLPREKKALREKLRLLTKGTKIALIHESPFRVIELVKTIADELPDAKLSISCDLTKMHEKTLQGTPAEMLTALQENPKTEKGEYCLVLDLHDIPDLQKEEGQVELSLEARIVEEMNKNGLSLRDAQSELIMTGEKKNAVKQAALNLKKMFE